MNEYFQTGAVPAPSSPGASSVMRQEFANIAAGFDKLPVLSGHQGEIVVVNASGTALVTSGAAIGDYVTKDGVFTLTNKTIAWADNTFPGFGTGATKNAGLLADNVLLLAESGVLPAMDAGNLTNIPGLDLKADASNAVLTGAPTCPTPATGDSSARIANTQFVADTLQAIGTFAPSNAAPLMNGAVVPGTSPLGSRGDHVHPSDTSRAPASAATAVGTSFTPSGGVGSTDVQGAIQELDSEKAPLASPVFTGDPKAPTAAPGDNDTSIATTAFVQLTLSDRAPLASPVFTGDPRAPTPLTSDNDTSIATTAFVQSLLAQQPPGVQVSNSTPLINGVAVPGTGVEASRHDHVHPVDTSRAQASASTATGTSFTPAGNIAATNVQAAIQELDTEVQSGLATKVAKSGDTMTGTLKAPMLQAGVSVTPANNFVLNPSANDGTVKLARESGQDIMTVDAAGKVAFPQLLNSLGASGYAQLPNGLILQWGRYTNSTTPGAVGVLTFPIPFPTAIIGVIGTSYATGGAVVMFGTSSVTGVNSHNSASAGVTQWLALGY